MITHLFSVILRCIAIPIVAILILQNTPLGERGAWLAVLITLVIVNGISIIIDIIKIFPNSLLLKGGKVFTLILSIIIEVGSVVAFLAFYSSRFD